MTKRPIIGVTLDAEEPGGYSKLPWYALRKNYFSALAEAGGLPVALPHDPALAEQYLDMIDGLLITGGAFDVDPSLYGGGPTHPTVTLKAGRTDFELAVTRGALARNMPVLGICGGQQLLAVAFGGTLIQHIPDSVANALEHEQPTPRHLPGHEVTVAADTLLARIVAKPVLAVNSAHHQAVATAGPGAVVNAVAPDGVVEGVEHPGFRFALGVQWHPEFHITPADTAIFSAFVAAARN
jgi:putative glutamine amidotransferase